MQWSQPFSSPRAAYLHIPFCRRRCFYCDFPISVVGDRRHGENSQTIGQYVEQLCREIRTQAPLGSPLATVFFGGGTPSLLSVPQLAQILETLDRRFGLLKSAEISMEVDPGTFTLAQIQGYRQAGVNRFSLGIQAFQSELLIACGRSHSLKDVYDAAELFQQAEVSNYSLDLISGLPHQTIDQWQFSLEQAIGLSPQHISVYDLTIEATTPFGKQFQPGKSPLPSDTLTANFYRLAQQTLTQAGFEHYEISNYAQLGYQCQHNLTYWQNQSFYGFGMGATSYLQGDRVARPRTLREYYAWLDRPHVSEPAESAAPRSATSLSLTEVLLETLMVGLRLATGFRIEPLIEQFGMTHWQTVWRCLQPYQAVGWVDIQVDIPAEGGEDREEKAPIAGQLRLSDPEGFLFSNVVLVKLFQALEEQAD